MAHDGNAGRDEVVLFERRGNVGVVTLNRPRVRNAINVAMARALGEAVTAIEEDPSILAWVLSAAANDGNVFCAGADLRDVAAGRAPELTTDAGLAGFTHRHRQKPVIAAVNGLATAGGCELVLACDMVVATSASSFGLAEVTRNLLASAGGVYRLPLALGRRVGLEAVLTGNPVGADRAYQLGMVNRLAEAGHAEVEAVALAAAIAANAPLAVKAAFRLVGQMDELSQEEFNRLARAESVALRDARDTAEAAEAFFEKRPEVDWQMIATPERKRADGERSFG